MGRLIHEKLAPSASAEGATHGFQPAQSGGWIPNQALATFRSSEKGLLTFLFLLARWLWILWLKDRTNMSLSRLSFFCRVFL